METVLWFAGLLLTLYGLKFVFAVFKRLGSKESMNTMIDRMEDKMSSTATKVANSIRTKNEERKVKKYQKEMIKQMNEKYDEPDELPVWTVRR